MNKETTNKLLKYSAAAGAGAFSLSNANAEVIWQSQIDGFTSSTLINGNPNFDLDIDNDNDFDLSFSVFTGATQEASAFDFSGNSFAVSPSNTDNVYVYGFELNETIGASSLSSTDNGRVSNSLGRWSTNYGGYLVNNVSEGYVGVEFDNDGNTHYGWVAVSLTAPTSGNLQLEITDYAWENVANTGINAGAVPEPSTYALGLGLLALGAAGIRARRRV